MGMSLSSNFFNRTKHWWSAKAGFLTSLLLCYLALHHVRPQLGFELLFWALIAIFGIGTLGHIINDWTDIEEDKVAHKSNTMAAIPVVACWAILLVLLVLSALPWLVGFKWNSIILALVIGEVVLFGLYSLKPVRLKRFPLAAVCLDALYAYVNPSLFLWFSFQLTLGHELNLLQVFVLIGWTFTFGLRQILNHHVHDAVNDRISNTPNLANTHGSNSIMKVLRLFILPLELLFMAAFLLQVAFVSEVFGGVLVLIFALIILAARNKRFPYVNVRFGKLSFDTFYVIAIGLISLLFLALHHSVYLILVPVFILLFTDWISHPALRVYAARIPISFLTFFTWHLRLASLVFNWTLYYFRKWILGWSEERNWGEHYATMLERKRLDSKGNVAVFNQNYSKYSETFVAGQTKALDYRTFYYYGWPKPLFELRVGNLIDSEEYIRKLKYALLHVFNHDVSKYENDKIAQSLVYNKIAVIVAHFGPMGTTLIEPAKQAGVPIVVIFHGYDAWNLVQLEEWKERYKELFRQAAAVVGVSRDICTQLGHLGCPSDKIHYLPAFVNPAYFDEQNVPSQAPVFLSVGRFSRTKSPHLTILAFNEVLKTLPNAQLVLVGQDDGEGLFEACFILGQSLGIENSIQFKGTMLPSEVMNEMKLATVFVQSSVTTPIEKDKEGTPVALMEAMAMGMAVVATNHGGMAELIKHNDNGILVEEFDYKSMSAEMIRLVREEDLRNRIGANAKKSIRENELIYSSLQKFSSIIDTYKLKQ